ncbi:hypothetical protein VPH35_007787 [Triticum aestivum]
MSTAASTSDNGSRHPRSDHAPSTRAGAPSSWFAAPLSPSSTFHPPLLEQHGPWAFILYFTRLGAAHGCIVCSSLDRSGGSHGPPLPTASPFPAAYCKHGE